MSIFSYICFGFIFLFLFICSNTFLNVNFLDLNCTAQARGRLIREYIRGIDRNINEMVHQKELKMKINLLFL